jgi:hypothetical protein
VAGGLLNWARDHRVAWVRALKSLRLGAWGTFELRNGKRVDTTLESIVERKNDIAEMDAAILRDEADDA